MIFTNVRRLRVEDLLLFGWLVLQPIVLPEREAVPGLSTGTDVVAGLLDLAALLLAAACLGARSAPGIQSGLVRSGDVAYAVGPLFGSVAFALDDISEELRLPDALALAPIVFAVAVALLARWRIPPLATEQRRALVTPFVLLTTGFYSSFVAGLGDIFDVRFPFSAISEGRPLEALLVLGIGLLAAGVFYLMFVFAPRQIAEREGTGASWTARFLVFIVGLSIGTTLANVAAGG